MPGPRGSHFTELLRPCTQRESRSSSLSIAHQPRANKGGWVNSLAKSRYWESVTRDRVIPDLRAPVLSREKLCLDARLLSADADLNNPERAADSDLPPISFHVQAVAKRSQGVGRGSPDLFDLIAQSVQDQLRLVGIKRHRRTPLSQRSNVGRTPLSLVWHESNHPKRSVANRPRWLPPPTSASALTPRGVGSRWVSRRELRAPPLYAVDHSRHSVASECRYAIPRGETPEARTYGLRHLGQIGCWRADDRGD
jgi:hypothetical protein